eukprot:TRINITY_DN3898_c0_g7_i1.p1 TRINITY_DN3898_c0_g7~~TRINITY_DN3898_c0_g7_i1.p1  ORF type:complete len:929 (+),score=216.30 TRINITY_DN3898_c0_g7_i1:119-2905(+)
MEEDVEASALSVEEPQSLLSRLGEVEKKPADKHAPVDDALQDAVNKAQTELAALTETVFAELVQRLRAVQQAEINHARADAFQDTRRLCVKKGRGSHCATGSVVSMDAWVTERSDDGDIKGSSSFRSQLSSDKSPRGQKQLALQAVVPLVPSSGESRREPSAAVCQSANSGGSTSGCVGGTGDTESPGEGGAAAADAAAGSVGGHDGKKVGKLKVKISDPRLVDVESMDDIAVKDMAPEVPRLGSSSGDAVTKSASMTSSCCSSSSDSSDDDDDSNGEKEDDHEDAAVVPRRRKNEDEIRQSAQNLKFEVLPAWTKSSKQLAAKMGAMNTARRLGNAVAPNSLPFQQPSKDDSDESSEEEVETGVNRSNGRCGKITIHPNSFKRGIWDTCSLILVAYDVLWIPLIFFNPEETVFTLTMEWVTRLFWSCDMAMSFFTGYTTNDGFIEMRPALIAKRYARTWLALDCGIVGVDWLEIIWSSVGGFGYARIGRAARAMRIIRMVRLLRLLRLKQLVMLLFEYVRSETVKEMSDMIKIILVIIGSAHLLACFWYGLSEFAGEDASWTQELFSSDDGVTYRYLSSLHWSLSQFSGGMDEMKPTNVSERLYAVFVYLMAFMMGAALISSLTSSMTHLSFLANEKSAKLTTLRQYLNDNKVSSRLALRVQRNAQHAMMEQQLYIPEGNVELLKLVSEPLRIELHFEMYAKILNHHPFFEEYMLECPHIMQKVCHLATSMAQVSAQDIIFNVGEIPLKPKMIIVVQGTLTYVSMGELYKKRAKGAAGERRRATTVMTGNRAGTFLTKGMWISEAALWTHWMHRGILTAQSDAQLCLVDAEKFADTVAQFDIEDFNPKIYAQAFVNELNEVSDVSDMPTGVVEKSLKAVDAWMTKMKNSGKGLSLIRRVSSTSNLGGLSVLQPVRRSSTSSTTSASH